MAIVTAGNVAIDVNNPQIGALAEADRVIAAGANFISLGTDLYVDEFYGSFLYDVFGQLAGGTLNRWRETFNGQLVFDISGVSVDVGTFLGWIETDANLTAASSVLAGADVITGSVFGDNLWGWAGSDSIVGGGGVDTVDGGAGDDTVSGGSANDLIRDASGTNYLRGDDGDDSIAGGSGFDDINGNMGNDTCTSGGGDDWVVGGKDNDRLTGSSGQNLVYGNIGADTCDGGAGNDIVRGGQDNDTLVGGAGDDFLSGDRGDDTITGGSGADVFNTFGEGGLDRVLDFRLTEGDRVRLDPGTQYTVAQVGADTVISMVGGAQMVLVGVSMSTLTDGWIFTG